MAAIVSTLSSLQADYTNLPTAQKDRQPSNGKADLIRYATTQCSLGTILAGRSSRGVCSIVLGDDAGDLVRVLQGQFPQAQLIDDGANLEPLMASIARLVDAPSTSLNLALDIQGTPFQKRVWKALSEIPSGSTVSYKAIAERIGAPKAVRAVASACGANRLAVAIPCHRVLRQDGGISGYRWGIERKRELLRREAAT